MENKKFNLEQLQKIMEFRLKTWQDKKKADKLAGKRVDVCLIASIVDIKEDINTIKRAIKLNDQYNKMLGL